MSRAQLAAWLVAILRWLTHDEPTCAAGWLEAETALGLALAEVPDRCGCRCVPCRVMCRPAGTWWGLLTALAEATERAGAGHWAHPVPQRIPPRRRS